MKEKFLKTADGVKIAINIYETGKDEVTIVAPGWFMTKDSKYIKGICDVFAKHTDVIGIDFRGHGKSGGFYEFTKKEENDINAVIDFAFAKYNKINLCGLSLGGALVITAGAKYAGRISKVIAISAPSCFEKIENAFWKKEAFVPTFQKFEFRRWISIRPALPFGRKPRPIDVVQNITCPLLFMAGEKDPTVGFELSRELYEKATAKKTFELFKGGYHAEDLFIQFPGKFKELCVNHILNE